MSKFGCEMFRSELSRGEMYVNRPSPPRTSLRPARPRSSARRRRSRSPSPSRWFRGRRCSPAPSRCLGRPRHAAADASPRARDRTSQVTLQVEGLAMWCARPGPRPASPRSGPAAGGAPTPHRLLRYEATIVSETKSRTKLKLLMPFLPVPCPPARPSHARSQRCGRARRRREMIATC